MVYRAGIYTYHADIYLYLVFDSNFKISYVLIGQKQDAANVFLSICHRPPTNPVGASDSAKLVQTARKCKSYFRNVAKLNTMRTLVVHDNDKNSDFTE